MNIRKTRQRLVAKILSPIGKRFPKFIIQFTSLYNLHRPLNIRNPKDFNEKINWLKFNSDINVWARLADKYEVRGYLKEKGLEDKLSQIYGLWSSSEEIYFNLLPDSFVLKTTSRGGNVILVQNKNEINIANVKKRLTDMLKVDSMGAYVSYEPQYNILQSRIIAEEMLVNDNPKLSSSIIDYKFICLNGIPHYILICYDREIGAHTELALYDLNWNNLNDRLSPTYRGNIDFPKPHNFDEMVEISKILSEGFPQVRVDLYESNNKVYFGEMTFTGQGGFIDYFTREFLVEIGEKIRL